MTDLFSLAIDNLLSPPILFFALGFLVAALRSDLAIPEAIGKGIALYLMMAIGFKGGAAMASTVVDTVFLFAVAAGIALSFAIPLAAFALLRMTSAIPPVVAAAVSAHYGSVSVVTFVTATAFLTAHGIAYESYLVAIMALMETPAIVSGLWLAWRFGGSADKDGAAIGPIPFREILLNGSIVLLVGSFLVGWATGEDGLRAVSPFIIDPFPGVLCLFLLDMGLLAWRQYRQAPPLRLSVVAFGIYMPLIGACLGIAGGLIAGLSLGGTVLLGTLAASASYIAVPAALRIALPKANPSVPLTLSLAITFPFNILLGIPLYLFLAETVMAL